MSTRPDDLDMSVHLQAVQRWRRARNLWMAGDSESKFAPVWPLSYEQTADLIAYMAEELGMPFDV